MNLWSQARRRTHHQGRGQRALCQEVYQTTHHRRESSRRPSHRTGVGISPTRLSRTRHEANAPACTITLSKKESRTKVAKNCTKSLYSQVSVKIFDKVKQSHLSVSQSQLKLGEKSPKKKP